MNSPAERRGRQDFIKNQKKSDKPVRNIQIHYKKVPRYAEAMSEGEMAWKDQTEPEGTSSQQTDSSDLENCTNAPKDESSGQDCDAKGEMETENISNDENEQTSSSQTDETVDEDKDKSDRASDDIDDECSEDEDEYNMYDYYDDDDDIEYAYEIGKYAKPIKNDEANMLTDIARTGAPDAGHHATGAASTQQTDETGAGKELKCYDEVTQHRLETQIPESDIYKHYPDVNPHHQQGADELNLAAMLEKLTSDARYEPIETPSPALNDPWIRATLLRGKVDAFFASNP